MRRFQLCLRYVYSNLINRLAQIAGGDFYQMFLYGTDANVTISDSLLHNATCMFALDGFAVLRLSKVGPPTLSCPGTIKNL